MSGSEPLPTEPSTWFSTWVVKPDETPDWKIIGFMTAVHILAIPGLFMLTPAMWALFLTMYFVTACLGVTLGLHRLLTHRSFKTTKNLERFFGLCGALSMQGGVGEWVAHHRMHHAGSDTPKDPHDAKQGFWFSHIRWLFRIVPEFDDETRVRRFARDVYADPVLTFLSKSRNVVLVQVVLGVIFWSIWGWPGVFCGIFLRLVAVYHATWFVNSACHMWGYKNFKVNDSSTNCWWVAVLSFGEGWHNNHHRFGQRCKAGYRWWEIDVTYMVILLLKRLGLAWDIQGAEGMREALLTKQVAKV